MNRYQLHKVQDLLSLLPRHDIVILTETKETKTTRKPALPGYVNFDLLAFSYPRKDGFSTTTSGGIKIMCREKVAKYMTLWHKDPDHNYLWVALSSADEAEVTFIGGMLRATLNLDWAAYDCW